MAELNKRSAEQVAEEKLADIQRAAGSWAKEVPTALQPAVRAVCVRLAEMVADQRHYLAPLPGPQESEREQVLRLLVKRLTSKHATAGIERELKELSEMELRSTGSWSLVPTAQAEWINTAIQFLEHRGKALPEGDRPDPYWADDLVAGVIASVRAVIGVDELQARTEAQFGRGKQTVEE
ncbi:MAG TPA: hypothetical protein VFS28_03160 [Gemmatimonadales bacterium]|jgi:hypothetical protein|nr:hypothetical protein [Gemmatimonadales bacterium]